jgi:uncharacterized protein YndB with AHSA1/START domain
MSQADTTRNGADTFRARASTTIAADPERTWALVGDLARSPEWSPECTGGEWVAGRPATVGSVFRGENHRDTEVVAWAPVVRGHWTTEMEVVEAERLRTMSWAMRTKDGQAQDSVWSFDLEPAENGGTVLTHRFRMGVLTEGMRGIVADMTPAQEQDFYQEWGAKVEGDLRTTVDRIRGQLER